MSKPSPRKGDILSQLRLSPTWQACIPIAVLIVLFWGVSANAQDGPPKPEELKTALDTVWVLIAAFLVFFMNAGFGMLETGFCRQKNAVNVLSKNLIVFALSTIGYWAIGYGLMFGNGNPYLGTSGFFLNGTPETSFSTLAPAIPLEAHFLFQLVFAGTAATIVSGAVAERIKFVSFLIFSLVLTGILYPVTGHWIWAISSDAGAGGWLNDMGFLDFAGSTVVHSVGGWAALTGALMLGPRLGRYSPSGATAMPGHNMSIATLGCLILWLGWFGFNPGSTLAADPVKIAHIALTTNTAAAFGGVAATLTAWFYLGKPDLSMIINGILAGLVGITAGCDAVTVPWAAVIGLIAGVLVVFSVTFFDKLKIDDPVGATSVHLVCGIWGTLAVGLFINEKGLLTGGDFKQLGIQIVGILAVAAFTLITTAATWFILKAIAGIRVSQEEEIKGLDIGEHGMEAYSGFLKEG
jgi:Amt family ammonium transporter